MISFQRPWSAFIPAPSIKGIAGCLGEVASGSKDDPVQLLKVARPPSGPLWVHEIKHDGYRLMVRRDGARVRCFTKGRWGRSLSVDAAARLHVGCIKLYVDENFP